MRFASTVLTISIGVALWVASVPVQALGFGRIGNTTQLGQPLNFAATVRLDADESLSRECVAAEVMVGETRVPNSQVRVTLEIAPDISERIVRVTTSGIVDEPVVTVGVTLGCTSKVTRKFVAFIDPPLINAPQVAPAEAALMVPQRSDSQVAPLVSIVEGESPRVAAQASTPRPPREPRAARPAQRSRPVTSARAAAINAAASAPGPTSRKPAARARSAQAPRPAASGPRLELEAAPAVVAQAASAAPRIELPVAAAAPPPASAASAASAPASIDEQAVQLALERERFQQLEQGLAKLRADSQATQQTLTTLQARLQAAESERYANPLVYALAWLSALLALAVGVLWWRQSRSRGAAQWWAPPPVPAPTPRAPAAPPPSPESVTPTTMSGVAPAYEVSTLDPASMPAADLPMTMPAAALRAGTPPAPVAEAARELSVEELIDLEQQAEFFVVLGQDEAAIELLMSHVRNDAGISPLPYLKLLEIYRRRGESDAYERIRERFNRRFNAYAPGWNDDLQQGQSLEAYPETVQRLQELWASPAKAMDTLAASLFRRDASDQTYDLPAYRELLFLYSIARDFAEHGVADIGRDVDLLLPMADEHPPALERLAASDMMAFQSSALTQPLDLDVSFAPPVATGAEITSTGLRPDRPASGVDSGLIDFDIGEPGPPHGR